MQPPILIRERLQTDARRFPFKGTPGGSAQFPNNTALIQFITSLYPVPGWHWISRGDGIEQQQLLCGWALSWQSSIVTVSPVMMLIPELLNEMLFSTLCHLQAAAVPDCSKC